MPREGEESSPFARRALRVYFARHVRRFLRSPAFAHRIFDARRGGADRGGDEKSEGIRDAGGGDHRPREHVWRDRVLPGGGEGGDQADHRLRGVYGAGIAHSKKSANAQREAAFHFTLLAQNEHGLPQSREARLDRASRRDVLQAAHRQGTARAALGGADRAERLPEGRDQPGDHRGRLSRRRRSWRRRIATSSARRIFSSSCTTTASRRRSSATGCCRSSRRISGSGWSRRTTCIFSNAPTTRRTT